MSSDIRVNITRAGIQVNANPLKVQLDLMSQTEARAYGGAEAGEGPYFRYWCDLQSLLPLVQGDLLTDTTNIDPKTDTYKKYRIIGDPEPFPLDYHTEFVVDRVIGK